jgi:hypothetical protein
MTQDTQAPAEAKPRIVLTQMEAQAVLLTLYGLIRQYPGRGHFFHLTGNTNGEKFAVEVRDEPDRHTNESLLKSVDIAVAGGSRTAEILAELKSWKHDPLIVAIDIARKDHLEKKGELELSEQDRCLHGRVYPGHVENG